MLKCNHPSLGSNNTSKLGALYAFILQWINDNTVDPPENKFGKQNVSLWFLNFVKYSLVTVSNPSEDFMNTILPHIFEMVQLSGAGNARRCTAAVLSEKYDEWKKSKTQRIPPLDTVTCICLKWCKNDYFFCARSCFSNSFCTFSPRLTSVTRSQVLLLFSWPRCLEVLKLAL